MRAGRVQAHPPARFGRLLEAAGRRPRLLHTASVLLLGLSILAAFLAVAPDLAPSATLAETAALTHDLPIDRRHPTFAEEFDELRLQDRGGPWRTRFDYAGIAAYTLPSNGEKQLYVDRDFRGTASAPLGLNPFRIVDGALTITAKPVSEAQAGKMWGYRYASGLLTTRHRFAQRYGYFEMRARLTDTPALWPAFWLLPEDGTWPPEIDVFEQLGRTPATITMSTVSHGAAAGGKRPAYTHTIATVPTAASGFHTYGLLWTPRRLIFYIDRQEVGQTATPADMHKPMYLLTNLAVGGPWAHDPDPSRPARGSFTIDYIRIYALNSPESKPTS